MTQPLTYPTVKYPSYITPAGQYHLLKGRIPEVILTSHDGTVEFYLMGGRAITDHMNPEAVHLRNIKGLIPPWQMIDQKGATQDGTSFVTALYDPMEIELEVEARGRDPQHTRQVVRDLYASLDPKRESTLSFITHEHGHWWTKVRWLNPPDEPLERIQTPRQRLTIRLRADSAFWRTYDDVTVFEPAYADVIDTFDTDYSSDQNLGPNWPQHYMGAGSGYCSTSTGATGGAIQVRWYESGSTPGEVVNGPYKGFRTETDNQVVEIKLGRQPEWHWGGECYNDIWLRMNDDGADNWDGDGVRVRIGVNGFRALVRISRFNNFVETTMREERMWHFPCQNDVFRVASEGRTFKVWRNRLPIMTYKEVGTGSEMGPNHRGVGFGMYAGQQATFFFGSSQRSPAWVAAWSAADNAEVTQEAFLPRVNIGDQPMFDDYTVIGPGTFRFYDGPFATSNDYVEFGPLLPNQVVFIRTHPGKRTLHDLTVAQPTSQEKNVFQHALEMFLSFAFANNTPPLMKTILSLFGIQPPQGPLWTLLKGRFSDNAAIPPKPAGKDPETYYVKVGVKGANADTRIFVAGTPLRTYPM